MNAQEIFDTAYNAILAQGKPAMDEHAQCMYRAPDGSKCAFGHLIPDELYDRNVMEGESADTVLYDPAIAELFPKETHALIQQLQHAHDNAAIGKNMIDRYSGLSFIDGYKANMRQVADTYDLYFNEDV